jgi:hypothetical protein
MAPTHLAARKREKESPRLTATSAVATEWVFFTTVSHDTALAQKISSVPPVNNLRLPQLIYTFAFGGLARVR